MKRAALAGILIICILLSGCGQLLDGAYIWTQLHSIPVSPGSGQNIAADNYDQLYNALVTLVEAGTVQATISVEKYDRDKIEQDTAAAIAAVRAENPIAAYAVADIVCTLGTSGGETVLAVDVAYIHDQAQISKIHTVADNGAAAEVVAAALDACETGIVLKIENYEPADFAQIVEDYAFTCPEAVMETPQVAVNIYPEMGQTRVVEIKFSYQTSRDNLKNMQSQVENLFKSAQFFASGHRTERARFTRLYTWLMETNEYTIQTSITPAYSLLQYGIGDSRAIATVYASLCRRMGLECLTVTGTRDGESWYWNILCIDGTYVHIDLLRCSEWGHFRTQTDGQMAGYVWDYDAYPNSPDPEPTVPETTAPTAPETTETTVPKE